MIMSYIYEHPGISSFLLLAFSGAIYFFITVFITRKLPLQASLSFFMRWLVYCVLIALFVQFVYVLWPTS